MRHDWFPASGGGLIATMWMNNPLKVALLKDTYVPNPDAHRLWTDVAAHDVVGTGYTAGGQALANKSQNYDATQDRTNLLCDDNSWAAATISAAFAAIYDDSGSKPLWSLVDFEGVKDVVSGVFTIDWSAVGSLYVTKA